MTTPARRPYAWLLWLLAFLAVELPAALRKTGGTLSEVSWFRWWPTKRLRAIPCAFLLLLTVHIFDGGQHWWSGGLAIVLTGTPVALSIVWAEWERRSKVSIWSDVKLLLKLRAARERLREAAKMGKLKTVAFALVGAVVTGAMAQITGACPDLLSALPAISMAGIGSGITYLMRKPLQGAKTKALLMGAGAIVIGSFVQQINSVCGAGFTDKIPSLAMAGAWIGLGLWLKAPHESSGLGSVNPNLPSLKG
jgi:hypothetical protein